MSSCKPRNLYAKEFDHFTSLFLTIIHTEHYPLIIWWHLTCGARHWAVDELKRHSLPAILWFKCFTVITIVCECENMFVIAGVWKTRFGVCAVLPLQDPGILSRSTSLCPTSSLTHWTILTVQDILFKDNNI